MKPARCGALLILTLAIAGSAFAQTQYPAKPLRLIVPFPPGGGTDTLARVYGQKLGDTLGQQVLIDNRSGGGTNIGADIAAKSPPDGYTALMGNIAHTINVTLYTKLTYDFVKDFAPVTLLASTPNILVVHPSTPELPTISEAGYPGYEAGTWYGLLVPAGTSKEIVARLNAESIKLLRQQDVKDRLDAAGFELIGNSPEQFAAYIRTEIDKWGKVVKASGVRVE